MVELNREPNPTEPGLPEGEVCGNCRWYIGNKDKHGSEGFCRFNPPSVFPNPVRKSQLDPTIIMTQAQFLPLVTDDFFCGHFKEKS